MLGLAVTLAQVDLEHAGIALHLLHQGTVLCEGPVEQVQRDPRVLEVYLGQRHAKAEHAVD